MAKPEHPKPQHDGVRGAFLLTFFVITFGIFLLCWLMFRNTELADKLFGITAAQKENTVSAANRPKPASHFTEADPSEKRPGTTAVHTQKLAAATTVARNVTVTENEAASDDQSLASNEKPSLEATASIESSRSDVAGQNPDLGLISGMTVLRGNQPANPTVDAIKNDPNCGKFYAELPKMKFLVVGSDGQLADVVITLKGENIKDQSTGESASALLIDQKACEYFPYIAAVQTRQVISVRNSDPVMHNVHPVPSVAGNKEANKAQMPKSADLNFVFEKPEEFLKFKCDIHSWMFSYITVVDHPYFAVSDKNGFFAIKNVPPGDYEIVAKHRKAGSVSQKISVTPLSKGSPKTALFFFEMK